MCAWSQTVPASWWPRCSLFPLRRTSCFQKRLRVNGKARIRFSFSNKKALGNIQSLIALLYCRFLGSCNRDLCYWRSLIYEYHGTLHSKLQLLSMKPKNWDLIFFNIENPGKWKWSKNIFRYKLKDSYIQTS